MDRDWYDETSMYCVFTKCVNQQAIPDSAPLWKARDMAKIMVTKLEMSYREYIFLQPNYFYYTELSVCLCDSYIHFTFVSLTIFEFLRFARKFNAVLEVCLQGKRQCDIDCLHGASEVVVSKAGKWLNQLDHEGERPGRRIKSTFITLKNQQIIKMQVQQNSRVSMRKIAREIGIKNQSGRLSAKQKPWQKPYKTQKTQVMTDKIKHVWVHRCHQLIFTATGQQWEWFIFSLEKLYIVEPAKNRQNDSHWPAGPPHTSDIIELPQNLSYVMVWGGICLAEKTHLGVMEQLRNSTRSCVEAPSSSLWYFHGPCNTLAMHSGWSRRLPLRPTERIRLTSGAKYTSQVSSHLQNAHHTLRI